MPTTQNAPDTTYMPDDVREMNGGTQARYHFDNGYGASVIQGPHTYGGTSGLWELAILGPDGRIDYTTPITEDVMGWLTDEQVQHTLGLIESLPEVSA